MRPGTGRALTAVGVVIAVAAIVMGTLSFVSALWLRSETFTSSYPVTAELSATSDCGPISVVAGRSGTIDLTGRIRWSFGKPTISSDLVGGVRVVEVMCPSASFEVADSATLVLSVPAATSVRVRASSGSIRLEGLEGTIDVSSNAGRVLGSGLRSPSVTASSSAGSVRLSFSLAPMSVAATSSAGGVQVLVPEGEQTYRVAANSSAGSTDVTVKTDQASGRSIVARSSAGPVRVGYVS